MAIILASKSPRRQELMRLLGLEFTIHTADVDETMDKTLPPERTLIVHMDDGEYDLEQIVKFIEA